MLKRVLCLLLSGLMLMSTVACAANDTDGEVNAETTAAVTEAVETELKPNLPEKDFGGESFRILGSKTGLSYLLSENTKGEEVNDALVNANLSVANQFNIDFETILVSNEEDNGIIRAYIMAGNDEYDVAYLHDCATANMSLEGWFLNIYDVPYLDPSAPWWPQFTVESLTLNEKMYYYSNYTSYLALSWTWGVFFNQKILRDQNLDSPYNYVREGTWTLEKIAEMSKNIYSDLNGDGFSDTGDLLGFSFSQMPYAWLESFGIEVWEKESPTSGELSVVVDERCYNLIESLHNWFHSGDDGVLVNFNGLPTHSNAVFTANRLAFTFERIGTLAPLAMESNIEYGIVPIPKMDMSQADYYAGCHDKLFSIPTTVVNTERVGVIMEAMAYEGYKRILPAYCETTLKTRLATDPDCGEMLNLIFDKQVISFSYLLNRQVSGGGIQIRLITETTEQNNIASFLQAKQKREEKVLKKITRFYEKD